MLICWNVERKYLVVHYLLISCTALEVAGAIDGAIRHDTAMDMDMDSNDVDSRRRPEFGFGITRLLGFDVSAQQHDQTIKCATAIRPTTAFSEAILRLLTRNASHSAYAALIYFHRGGLELCSATQ